MWKETEDHTAKFGFISEFWMLGANFCSVEGKKKRMGDEDNILD